ncbi:MAG: D-alanyl-D-alanine carboxypeptidase/D-alanyl-D-alanine-endopeptidase [Gammaproteobacteria bacterium]|nr:D-alanyl-D-alanine carboxypeptidase/D-alanyl-D-alanine-endopeptidase [Gammaproteobacteria bacterium]
MLLAPGLPAAPQTSLPAPVNRILVQNKLPESAVSAFVQRVGSTEPLLAFNEDVPRNPASVMKLVTTFAALEALGPVYQWKTEVYADGRINQGVLAGDLILKGYGDPYLVTERLWLLQRELRQRGLRDIDGDIVIDNSWFAREELDPGAFDGQEYRAYNALPDALLVNFQAVNFTFRPDAARGRVEISTDPVLANLDIQNKMRLFRGSCGSSKSGISMVVGNTAPRPRVTFSGALASQCAEYQLLRSVLDGPAYAYGAFRGLWEEQGGRIAGGPRQGQVPDGKSPFLTFQSPALAEVIRSVNKYSNNVMTRQLFLTLGAEKFGPPGTVEKGARAVEAALAARGLRFPELNAGNGAGLARESRISAASLGELLLAAHASPFQPEFSASLSIAGLDGTTRKRFLADPVAGDMHLKTGTLNGVTSIAGFVHSQSGAEYAVVMVVNGPKATWGGGIEAQNALLRWVHQR